MRVNSPGPLDEATGAAGIGCGGAPCWNIRVNSPGPLDGAKGGGACGVTGGGGAGMVGIFQLPARVYFSASDGPAAPSCAASHSDKCRNGGASVATKVVPSLSPTSISLRNEPSGSDRSRVNRISFSADLPPINRCTATSRPVAICRARKLLVPSPGSGSISSYF
jgi:hypothetical protein